MDDIKEIKQVAEEANEQAVIKETADESTATPALADHGYDNHGDGHDEGSDNGQELEQDISVSHDSHDSVPAPHRLHAVLRPKKPEPYKWSEEDIRCFLQLRRKYIDKFHTGKRGSIQKTYGEIIEEMGLVGLVSPVQARKKWNNMAQLYRRLVSEPHIDAATGLEISPAVTWPFFHDVQKTIELEPHVDPDECQVFEAPSLEDLSHIIQLAAVPPPDMGIDPNRASEGPRPAKRPKRDKEKLYSMIRELGRLNQKQEAILSAKNKLTIRLLNQLV